MNLQSGQYVMTWRQLNGTNIDTNMIQVSPEKGPVLVNNNRL